MALAVDATTAEHTRGIRVVIDGIVSAVSPANRQDTTLIIGPHAACPPGLACRRIGIAGTPVGRLAYQRLLMSLDSKVYRGRAVDRVLLLDAYAPLIRRRGVRYASLIHDVLPLTHPEYWSRPRLAVKRTAFRSLARAGAALFTSSEHNAAELYRVTGLTARVVRFGCGQLSDAAAESARSGPLPTRERYLLFVGAFEPRKDLETLIRAFELYVSESAVRRPLVLVGGGRPRFVAQVRERIAASPCHDHIEIVTDATRDRTLELLEHASALLFPSRAEGFGLPVLEALALGTPVVASDLVEIRSWAAETVLYARPGRPSEWIEPLASAVEKSDSERRAGQEFAAAFRWSGCADALLDF